MTSSIIKDLSLTPSHNYFAMKWHYVLKESSSPDSFKENYLSVLCASSAAGGEINQPFLGSDLNNCLKIQNKVKFLGCF